jgi:hypothetical protein
VAVTNLFIKVEIEHDDEEKPQKRGAEICRQILKIYGALGGGVELHDRGGVGPSICSKVRWKKESVMPAM